MGDEDEAAPAEVDPNQIDISELHATSAGMKGGQLMGCLLVGLYLECGRISGLCCERAALGIEDCRKACGGAAYLMSSGIAALEGGCR